MSLVLELQRDATGDSVDISSLLRKAKVVSSKLNLKEFGAWVDLELQGYAEEAVPPYRCMRGLLKAQNPMRGLIPLISVDPEVDRKVSTFDCRYSLSEIRHMAEKQRERGVFHLSYGPEFQQLLMTMQGDFPLVPILELSTSGLIRILDAVRNTILNWSLKLEAEGILGEGFSFTAEEKKAAERNASELQPPISITFIGSMRDSAVQVASPRADQHLQ